jgi:hypothetical protein
VAVGTAAAALLVGTWGAAAVASTPAKAKEKATHASTIKWVKPNAAGELDCNHWSTIQAAVDKSLLCTDIRGIPGKGNRNSWGGRFYDNGWYIGHDEPMVTYLSGKAGSGNNVTWTDTLGTEPSAKPTVKHPGSDVTHTFELTPAPWYSMAICNSYSYPQLPCTPESDKNAPSQACLGAFPCHGYPGAGSAFMELQFYPPGFAPFADAISCDNSHWCAALTLDSLECTDGFATCNPGCEEPVNFAFIQTNGVPTGPPSPQLADLATFTQNRHTLLMNPGDKLRVHIYDAPAPGGGKALETVVSDLTTHQTGYMQASAANGFMASSIVNCSGTPYNFAAEYSSAQRQNIVPWAADQVDISTQFETGHFEACNSLTGTAKYGPDKFWLYCHGVYERSTKGGDGKGTPEPTDAFCYPAGDRHTTLPGSHAPDEVTGCLDDVTQNGDLDFDGSPYWPDWPTSTMAGRFPGSFTFAQPTTVGGAGYPQYFFQTDTALSESTCTPSNPSGCAVPPPNAPGHFYPYWTLTSSCTWEFGNVSHGNTFGKDAQYGTVRTAQFGYPQIISRIHQNSCA